MRKIIPLVALTLLTVSCVPMKPVGNRLNSVFYSSSSQTTMSSSSSEAPLLPIEIEESSSSSAKSGTGSLAERIVDNGVFEIGNADTPHILTVFTNYACDYCREFTRDMLPRIEEEFVRGGLLRVRLVVVPLKKYPNSALETSALLCAGTSATAMQDMHRELVVAKSYDRASLLLIAKKLKLTQKTFTTCLDAKATKATLAAQETMITSQNITLIPAFQLDDQMQTGLPSYPDLRGWIRAATR